MKTRLRVRLVRIFIGFLLVLTLVLLGAWWRLRPVPPPPNTNALALGANARVDELDIPINPPMEFDGLTRADIYALRSEAVNTHADLLAADYTPSAGVFGEIIDGKPWWGMIGQWYHGPGSDSTRGASEESRYVLNPYLLVAPEFYGFSIFGGVLEWDTARISEADLNQPDFPLMCRVESLRWYPRRASAEATYDVSGCLAALNPYLVAPLTVEDNGWFDLFSYNARDLNLNYIYVDYAASTGVTHPEPAAEAATFPYFIHLGGSCQQPGGCNNMSPGFAALSNLELTALPAEIVVKLWTTPPPSVEDAADMTYRIDLR